MSYPDQQMVTPRLDDEARTSRNAEGSPRRGADGRTRGQALVETAILLPLLLILLLGAIDLGRAFFGWVNLHQAARIGANYAALNPTMTAVNRDEMIELIERDIEGINCSDYEVEGPAFSTSGGVPVVTVSVGDYAEVALRCDFALVTPLAGALFNGPLTMSADATFPVRIGCVGCAPPPPVNPPATTDSCRTIPNMVGLSVAGARLAWASAGFRPEHFDPVAGDDTATVATQTVTPGTLDPLSTCTGSQASFLAFVTVTVEDPDEGTDCATIPNYVGMTVSDARAHWEGSDFTGAFSPADEDALRALSQETTPASTPGVTCGPLDTSMSVTPGAPWPDAPPAPCLVPNLIDERRTDGRSLWIDNGFSQQNYTWSGNGNFVIKSQSLVGGSYVSCSATILVSPITGQ